MRHSPELIAASSQFWPQAASRFVQAASRHQWVAGPGCDYSAIRVIVPTFEHAQLFLKALAQEVAGNFIPPRINTVFAWLEMLPPAPATPRATAASERLMGLYAGLRQHAWLKKLFSARRNTDLLPLAQTLLSLSDELTLALLPTVQAGKEDIQQRWHAALAQMPPPTQKILSEEAQLVWTIWQSQLDDSDATVQRFQKLMQIARQASENLVWISPTAPDAMEDAFLGAYAKKKDVLPFLLDWRDQVLAQPYAPAWPSMMETVANQPQQFALEVADTSHIRLCETGSLEDEAQQGAQTIINWLQAGKQDIAVIAQDRVVARRIRALLERAQVLVADETGWKLSTTRAAAAIAAWFEVIATRADTIALLDLLKSPYLSVLSAAGADSTDNANADKADQVMHIELALRKANVIGGWDAILASLNSAPQERQWIAGLARLAAGFAARRSLPEWSASTLQTLDALNMQAAMQADNAGAQIIKLLQALSEDCRHMDAAFSFAEWLAFINLQLESAPFIVGRPDKRVMMLPLNGARLRSFDAVLLVGADAAHLPSQPQEVLFFTNTVRRECGLVTREARQRQQLRDFAELLLSNPEVVLSWQGHLDGEHNPLSPWLAQLNLTLQRSGQAPLAMHTAVIPRQALHAMAPVQPRPSAPQLTPATLSASGYISLIACPYQFFAGRMLGLAAIDTLSDMPEKKDYGDWLHAILKKYHDALLAQPVPEAEREALLRAISLQQFERILQQSPAALGYSVRWEKVIPAYVAWANQREQEGWQFELGEAWRERNLSWPDGAVLLRGRIDRMDKNPLGEYAVLDYKTKTQIALSKRLKDGEDHQLPFYGLLADVPVTTASYVALELERGKTGAAEAKDYTEWAEALESAIVTNMQGIQRGAPLPAQGTESVCQYCDVRGLCRKGAW
ncbi:MAG: PD-(D/E)XK nuclease family protein [Pseudomonadota bacterium]